MRDKERETQRPQGGGRPEDDRPEDDAAVVTETKPLPKVGDVQE